MTTSAERWAREREVLTRYRGIFSRNTLRKWRAEGLVVATKLGGVVIYDLASIERLFSSTTSAQGMT